MTNLWDTFFRNSNLFENIFINLAISNKKPKKLSSSNLRKKWSIYKFLKTPWNRGMYPGLLRTAEMKGFSIIFNGFYIVWTLLSLLGGWTSYQIFKKGGGGRGLDRISIFRGGLLGKRGWTFSGGCSFYIKNKLKSEIYKQKYFLVITKNLTWEF